MIMFFYVIAYDISDDKRRKKISDLLEGYGQRVQYSVFECLLTKKKYKELQDRLQRVFQPGEDNIRFYPLSKSMSENIDVWGTLSPIKAPQSIII